MQWLTTIGDKKLAAKLAKALDIHPITAGVLTGRGIKTEEEAEAFLRPRLVRLPDPYLLPDMKVAVDRIVSTMQKNEKITIYGDYDTDGITSTALLILFLRDCGISADYYLPNRISEGYGLSRKGIDEIKKRGTSLIITTDNGTNSHGEIAYAKHLGIDTVVTDHHEIPKKLPDAIAVINPKRTAEGAPFRELAGVGVAFYLAAALRKRFRKDGFFKGKEPDLKKYLDLVAIGTVADVAPLTGINRVLVKHGIVSLKKTDNWGLDKLAGAASIALDDIDTHAIAFRLAPRINASGRLGMQNIGLELLLTDDSKTAADIAEKLGHLNQERQSLERQMLLETEKAAEGLDKTRSSIVLWSEEWHPGVIGIVAARIAEKYRKPCAIISLDGDSGRGSVRTVGTFNIMETLNSCSGILSNFGGHAAAAGFDIEADRLEDFYNAFDAHISSHMTGDERAEKLKLDAELSVGDIDEKLISELEMLEPFGEGNPQPVFSTKGSFAEDIRIVGTNHLKLSIKSDKIMLDAIGFNMGGRKITSTEEYIFAGIPQLNSWNGFTSLQMKLMDFKTSR